ncbi:hypothetical protein PROVRETT_07108 [Providencia rettgeri DSM 1131]|nr:hypothetical protein PROVRETT_07108 [Providencia rettgeri DSM 1131]
MKFYVALKSDTANHQKKPNSPDHNNTLFLAGCIGVKKEINAFFLHKKKL